MALNWLEEIISHLYKLKGYMVIENEDLPMPRTQGRRVRGHSDIDVLAIKDNELIHVECQTWWGPSKKQEAAEFQRLKDRFHEAQNYIPKKYPFLSNSRVRNVFVTSDETKRKPKGGPWDRLQQFCRCNVIELVEIESVVKEFIDVLKHRYPPGGESIGREEGTTRLLIYLIHHNLL